MNSAHFLLNLAALERNARELAAVAEASGSTIVLALKAFACPAAFPVLKPHLAGVCASGLWEARLGHEEFGSQVITCAPAYREQDIAELANISAILDFNSLSQWQRFREQIQAHPRYQAGELRCGLRINPGISTQQGNPLYDPCAPGSRLGASLESLQAASAEDFSGLSGLHFHSLCEQGLDALKQTLDHLEEQFAPWLGAAWCESINFGGGHWITKPDYDREGLIEFIRDFRERWKLKVILEPGEAVAIHSGCLRTRVLDVFGNASKQGEQIAILDISATCHTPDILEMPYRAEISLLDANKGNPSPAALAQDLPHSYKLGGMTCLAGDIFGDYSFHRPLKVGDWLQLEDMAHYTLVKTSMFNGVPHPAIVLEHPDGRKEVVREFDYADFRGRLG